MSPRKRVGRFCAQCFSHATAIGRTASRQLIGRAEQPVNGLTQYGDPFVAPASIESLEQRQLLSASLNNGLLTVTGNPGSNNNLIVRLNPEKTEYIVGDNDTRRYFKVSDVKEIKVIGGDKDDFIDVYSKTPIPATIYGGKGNDRIFGGARNDTIYGGEGNDYIEGRGGNDKIYGEAGNDTIDAGNGNDDVDAGSGTNTVNGKTVTGPSTSNPTPTPSPTPSDETPSAPSGNAGVTLSGGVLKIVGNISSSNKLIVRGHEDNNYLVGFNDKRLYYKKSDVKSIVIVGGDKDDHIDVYANTKAPATIYGGKGNDKLYSGTADDKIYGGEGNDYIEGRGGNDSVYGEAGNDTLNAGNGNDYVYGGDGNDVINTASGNNHIDGGSGTNTINGKTSTGSAPSSGNPTPTPTPEPEPEPTPTPEPEEDPTPAPTPNEPVPGAPNAVIKLISSNIMAGQAIHAHAVDSRLNGGDAVRANYEWDFGDSSGKYNRLSGFNAAHVYDRPGTYTITLKVTNMGGKSHVVSTKVTVTSDTRKKFYVDAVNGSDSNPGTMDRPVKTLARAHDLFGDNTAIYFKRGQTHAGTEVLWMNYKNMVLGAYGSGDRPVLMNKTGDSTITMDKDKARDIMIQDITFDTEGAATNGVAGKIGTKGVWAKGTNVTIRNSQFLNVSDAILANSKPVGLLVQDNIAPLETGIRSYFVWSEGSDHVYLGNNIANSTREHIVRVGASGTDRLLMAHNTFSNISRKDVDSKDSAKGSMVMHKATYAWISHNRVIGGGGSGFGPLGGENGLSDKGARFQYGVLENNILETDIQVNHGTEHLMIRNNVLLRNEGSMINISGWDDEFGRGVKNVYIYNNTGYTDGRRGNFLKVEAKTDGIWMSNNLFSGPHYTVGSHNSAIIYIDGNDLSSFREVTNNVWEKPTIGSFAEGGLFYIWPFWSDKQGYQTPSEWTAHSVVGTEFVGDILLNSSYAPSSSSIAAKAGKVLQGVFADINGKARPSSGGWTAGAVQL